MPALVLVFALLLPQQTNAAQQVRSETIQGRVILISNSNRVSADEAVAASPTSVEMVLAPEGYVMHDPLWPGIIARQAAPPVIAPSRELVYGNAYGSIEDSQGETSRQLVPLSERIAAARQARGAAASPETAFRTGAFRTRLAARAGARAAERPVMAEIAVAETDAAEQAEPYVAAAQPEPYVAAAQPEPYAAAAQPEPYVAAAQPEPYLATEASPYAPAIAEDEGGLPAAYRVTETEPAFEIQQVSASDPMPLRIVQTEEVTLYFSNGAPVFLRVAPSTGGGCFLEYDYGLDGHQTVTDEGVFWMEAPNRGRAAVTVPTNDRIELNLRQAQAPNCELPESLSLYRNGRTWIVR